MESSDTRYALSGDVHVAYRVFGEGPFGLVFASGLDFPSVEFHDQSIGPGFEELAQRMRVIRFDKRGTGTPRNSSLSFRAAGISSGRSPGVSAGRRPILSSWSAHGPRG